MYLCIIFRVQHLLPFSKLRLLYLAKRSILSFKEELKALKHIKTASLHIYAPRQMNSGQELPRVKLNSCVRIRRTWNVKYKTRHALLGNSAQTYARTPLKCRKCLHNLSYGCRCTSWQTF